MTSLIDTLIYNARIAQAELEKLNQEQIDVFVKEFATVLYTNAEKLADMVTDETQMGNRADKCILYRYKAEGIFNHLKHIKTVGVLSDDPETGIIEIAEPVGVVASITPSTNPAGGAMGNTMFAIKGRNSIIICPHPRGKKTTIETVRLMVEAAEKLGLPKNSVQCIQESSKEISKELMSRADYILATGGAEMVRVAYSSGTPAYGVSAGNTPVFIDDTADIPQAVSDVCKGKLFDNGLVCSSEQSIIATHDVMNKIEAELLQKKAHFVSDSEKEKLKHIMFPDNACFPSLTVIGQSVHTIAERAGFRVADDCVGPLVVKINQIGPNEPFSGEKLSPVLVLYRVQNREAGIEAAKAFLNYQGAGHTSAIHASDHDFILRYASNMKTSRVIVNQPAITAGGNSFNGLTPTTMLGCGSWGHNATTRNISALDLINIKRVSFKLKNQIRPIEKLGK